MRWGQGGEPAQAVVLGAGQLVGMVGAEQVGAAGAADEQAAAGEHGGRLGRVAFVDQVREVLVGVAGGGHGDQAQVAEQQFVAVVDGPVRELVAVNVRLDYRAADKCSCSTMFED